MSGAVVRQSYAEIEAFERALRGVQGQYLPTSHPNRTWRLCQADLDDTIVTVAQEGGPNLYQGACAGDCFRAIVPLTRADRMVVNGSLLTRTRVAWLPPATEFSTRSVEASRWLAVSIPRQRVSRWLEQHSFADVLVESSANICADASSIQRMVALIRRVLHGGTSDVGGLESPAARVALGHELSDAALRVVVPSTSPMTVGRGRPRLNRRTILKRITGLIDERVDQPILIEDLCRAARVSSRTLHAVFIEQFGMSPHQYLMLLRLRAIHSALLSAEPTETVTDICARFGVWDYGRFAQSYRRCFGRVPSQARSSRGTRSAHLTPLRA